MGGFRSDGKLLESLERAVEVLSEMGEDTLSDDVEEAIERLKYPEYAELHPIDAVIPCIVCGKPGRHPKCVNRRYDETR